MRWPTHAHTGAAEESVVGVKPILYWTVLYDTQILITQHTGLTAVSYTHLDVYKRQELQVFNLNEELQDYKQRWK